MVEILRFHCRGYRLDPCSGRKIPQASQPKNKFKKKIHMERVVASRNWGWGAGLGEGSCEYHPVFPLERGREKVRKRMCSAANVPKCSHLLNAFIYSFIQQTSPEYQTLEREGREGGGGGGRGNPNQRKKRLWSLWHQGQISDQRGLISPPPPPEPVVETFQEIQQSLSCPTTPLQSEKCVLGSPGWYIHNGSIRINADQSAASQSTRGEGEKNLC